jgi:hypothetical protein
MIRYRRLEDKLVGGGDREWSKEFRLSEPCEGTVFGPGGGISSPDRDPGIEWEGRS